MSDSQTVGLYLGAKSILQNPGYLETLQKEIGLTHLVIGFSGELSKEILALSPFDGTPPSDECIRSLICRHIDGQPSTTKFDSAKRCAGPHMHVGGNDAELRQAIQIAKGLGLAVWMGGGAWTASDFDVLMYCPSQERTNRWYEAVYTYYARNYDIDGIDITHARYPMTSYTRGTFLCACDHCAKTAAETGYDMAQMVADIYDGLARLKQLDGKRFVDICQHAAGPFDFMQILGMKQGIIQWFKFRSELLGRNVERFRDAVHAAAGDDFVFGIDTYPASLSMFVGHNHARWAEFSDFASPLLSHVDIFPMGTLVAWAQFLRGIFPDIAETEALQVIYRLVGYDSLDMPKTIGDFALGAPDCEFRNMPLEDFVMLDMAKARLYLPQDIPSYPILQGGGAPHDWPLETIKTLIAGAEALGHQGVILQGTTALVDFDLKS